MVTVRLPWHRGHGRSPGDLSHLNGSVTVSCVNVCRDSEDLSPAILAITESVTSLVCGEERLSRTFMFVVCLIAEGALLPHSEVTTSTMFVPRYCYSNFVNRVSRWFGVQEYEISLITLLCENKDLHVQVNDKLCRLCQVNK